MLDGWSPWFEFFRFLPSMGYGRSIDGLFHPSVVANFSLSAFWMRALQGGGPMVRLAGMLSALTLFVLVLYVGLRTRGAQSFHLLVLPFTVLMVIASPLTWSHHLVYLFPGLFLAMRALVGDPAESGKWVWVGALVVLAAGSTTDYSLVYGQLNIPEVIRPILTSLNLYCLLGLLFASLTYAYRPVRRTAGGMRRVERAFDIEGVLPEQQ
jgi:alpha-1,2-mannosyltransferase